MSWLEAYEARIIERAVPPATAEELKPKAAETPPAQTPGLIDLDQLRRALDIRFDNAPPSREGSPLGSGEAPAFAASAPAVAPVAAASEEPSVFAGVPEAAIRGPAGGIRNIFSAAKTLADFLDTSFPGGKFEVPLTGYEPLDQLISDPAGSIVDVADTVLRNVAEPEGVVGGLTEGILKFFTGFAARGPKALATALAPGRPLTQAAMRGAAADAFALDPTGERISDLIEQSPALSTPITRYLESDEDDTLAENALKNALEGLVLGVGADVAIKGVIGLARLARSKKALARLQATDPSAFNAAANGAGITTQADIDALISGRATGRSQPEIDALAGRGAADRALAEVSDPPLSLLPNPFKSSGKPMARGTLNPEAPGTPATAWLMKLLNHPRILAAAKILKAEEARYIAKYGKSELDGKSKLPGTWQIPGPERVRIRTQAKLEAVKEMRELAKVTEFRREKRIVIVMGPPAAGKSTLAEPLALDLGARIVDNDMVKKHIPEYTIGGVKGYGAAIVHEEASDIGERILMEAMQNGENVIFPTVGREPSVLIKLIEKAERRGYAVDLILNDLDIEEAVGRSIERFVKAKPTEGNRFVAPRYIFESVGDRPRQAYDQIKTMKGVTSYAKYSNDVPRGQRPELLEAGGSPFAEPFPGRIHGRRLDDAGDPSDGSSPGAAAGTKTERSLISGRSMGQGAAPEAYAEALVLPGAEVLPKRSSKFGVGKEMGPQTYIHKSAVEGSNLPADVKRKVKSEQVPFEWNTIRYNDKTKELVFQEGIDFDTVDEPIVGRVYNPATKATTTHNKSVWHHKWQWVNDDYTGFSVAESKVRSRHIAKKLEKGERGNIGSLDKWAPIAAELDAERSVARGSVRTSPSEIDALWELPQQEIESAATSINKTKLPALINKVTWVPGTVNADIGGGKFDNATAALKEKGVENVVYDPFNRSAAENGLAVGRIAGGQADTATVSNVLNVIQEKEGRSRVIEQAADAVGDDGVAYFLVYEGSGKGVGKATTKGWQENRKTESYIKEIEEFFPLVRRKGSLLIGSKRRQILEATGDEGK